MDEKQEEVQEVKDDPLHEMRERFDYALEAWSENHDRFKEDLRFANGEQWPDEILKEREEKGQPCLVVDKLNQYIRQVVNDSRMNRPSIKVSPVDDGADIETAEIFQGLCRHIEYRSDASAAYDMAIESAVKGGFGFVRILTEYAGEDTFNQEICIERVRNPLSIIIDPDCKKADFSDMRFAFVLDVLDEDELEASYPDVELSNFEADNNWTIGEDKVVIAEYWEVVKKPVKIHLFSDGTVSPDEDYQAAIAEGLIPPDIKETREIEKSVVMWSKVCGSGYLEEQREWMGKYIPIVPVIGNEVDIDGKVQYKGLISPAKDAQRLYNYSRSAFAERVALAPKAPYIAAAGQVENYPEWQDANSTNYSTLTYDPVEISGVVVGAPQRQPASDIPAGFSQDMQLSEHDIQASIGMYAASLGAQSNEKSGRAIMARQREGDTGTFHYHDNLARAIKQVGKILVDLIPKVYDSKRVVRIVGVDESSEMVQIDPNLPVSKAMIGTKSIYNLNVGTYDVAVSAGASYTTKRQEAAEAMVEMTRGNPALMGLIGDLMIKSMDWPMADEIAERLKLMLPPEIRQAEQQKGEQSPEVQAIMMQAERAVQERDMQIQQAEQMIQQLGQQLNELKSAQDEKLFNAQNKQAELEIKAREMEIKAFEAETARLIAMAGEDSTKEAQIKAETDLIVNQMRADLEREKAQFEADTQIYLKQMDIANQNLNAIQPEIEKPTIKKVISITAPSGQTYTGTIEGE